MNRHLDAIVKLETVGLEGIIDLSNTACASLLIFRDVGGRMGNLRVNVDFVFEALLQNCKLLSRPWTAQQRQVFHSNLIACHGQVRRVCGHLPFSQSKIHRVLDLLSKMESLGVGVDMRQHTFAILKEAD